MTALFAKNPFLQIALVAVLALGCGLLTFQKEINTNGDNAAYITLAKSVAQGEGLRYINNPEKPKSDTFPIGYPLFLSVFIRLFGYNLFLLKMVMIVVFTACMTGFYVLAREVLKGKYLVAAMALTLTNYWLLDNASINLSELLFMLFILAGLLFFLKYSQVHKTSHLVFAAVFLVLSIFIRAVGVAFLLSILLFLVYRRRYWVAAAVFAGYLLLYFLHKPLLSESGGYVGVLFLKDPYAPYLGMWTVREFAARVYTNIVFYAGSVIQMTLLSFMSDIESLSPGVVIAFSILTVALLLAYPLKNLLSSDYDLFIRGTIVINMGVLIVRPEVWSGPRFIVPLIPFFYLIALQNLQWLGSRFLNADYLKKVQNLILVIALLWSVLNFGEAYRKSRTPLSEDWVDYLNMAKWAESNTDSTALFCARSPFIFYLKTSRRCVGIPVTPSPDSGLSVIKKTGVNYMVVDHFRWSGSTQRYVVPFIQAHPERFTPVFSTGRENATIYKVIPW